MGRTMVGSGCELTASYINKLNEYGFSGVYIEDEQSKDIYIEATIPEKLRQEGFKCVQENDIDRCAEIAQQIVENLLSRKNVCLDMTDLRSYDDYTYAHSVNVAVLCCVIGMGMGMSERDLNYLVTAALLHDLGKLAIPKEILNKPGRLTPDEYQLMKTHSTRSYQLLSKRWNISAHIKQTVLLHHENVDGSGYPQGLMGDEQSLSVRIVHVADVYDALTSRRPYKKPYSPYEAVEYLMGACGIMFDKNVVEVFMERVPLFPRGTEVNLDTVSPDSEEPGRKKMVQETARKKIMIVDDMKTNLDAMRGILEDEYTVILCKCGKQALHYLEHNEFPDLIIMDVDMPEMNGIETTMRANKLTGGRIPVLFVTAMCDAHTVMTCRRLHAAGYIVRPYKAIYIKSEVERIFSGWR